ncbi:Ig-like domain-containing protein, partial [Gillisia sp. Q332]|uniref:Ig-like domain-containing protein n=1 Tax=Gillisia xinjiangensis TaxID=3384765 RepID=UPI0039190649
MIPKLLKPYNLQFILIALLLLGSTGLYAQATLAPSKPGTPARFGIDADIETDRTTLPIDDWFALTNNANNGFPMIDDSNKNFWKSELGAGKNITFTSGPTFGQYDVQNNSILYDAIYARDYIGGTLKRDKTMFGESAKGAENPNNWSVTESNLTGTYDIVDMYAHVRREGETIYIPGSGGLPTSTLNNMWLNLGISIVDPSGAHYVDFELFSKNIYVNGTGTRFVSEGLDQGHTQWKFRSETAPAQQGIIEASGDLNVMFGFNGSDHQSLEVALWVNKAEYDTFPKYEFIAGAWISTHPNAATWVGPKFIKGAYESNSTGFGYASIVVPTNEYFAKANLLENKAPFWGTEGKNGPGTKYSSGALMEVGVNLTNLKIDPASAGNNPCDAPYIKIIAKTRTGSSVSSQIKDFVGPYSFLGTPVVSGEIAQPGAISSCTASTLTLSPLNPVAGATYIWTTTNGEFSNGLTTYVGQDAVIVKPGTYQLDASAFPGCFADTDEVIVYAKPCAADNTLTTAEDTVLTIATSDFGYTDADGDVLSSVSVTALPVAGILYLDANDNDSYDSGEELAVNTAVSKADLDAGNLQFLPELNDNATPYASFDFNVSDGTLSSAPTTNTITINVTPVNDAPVAVDDTATTDEDTAVNINVLANDTDVDGDTLTVTQTTAPTNGSVVINTDYTITYTPDANFNGTDTFTYTITDGNGGTDTATVTVTVNPINDAPVAVDDTATTDEDTAVTVSVLTNDTDVDGDTLTVTETTAPSNGSVVINGDGTITYTPNENFNG